MFQLRLTCRDIYEILNEFYKAKELNLSPGKVKALVDKEGKIATASATAIVYSDNQVFKLFPCRFEHLSFQKGLTHMDGETALKFVRSRHGTNNITDGLCLYNRQRNDGETHSRTGSGAKVDTCE